jgi:hypothetical protein
MENTHAMTILKNTKTQLEENYMNFEIIIIMNSN